MRILVIICDYHLKPTPHTLQTMDTTPSTPPPRPKGGELSVGRRIAIVVEVALAIPPGKVRIPKGALDPICQRYGVSSRYPRKLWQSVKDQIDAGQEVDLSIKERKGRPSLLTPTKVAARPSDSEDD